MIPAAELVLLALAILLLLATLLPFLRAPYWWVRMFDFPRAQITAGLLVVLALYGLVNLGLSRAAPHEWAVFVLLGLAVAYQVVRMLPYSPLYPVETAETVEAAPGAPEDRRLRLVVSNVRMDNRDVERWTRVVLAEDPDVIAAVETDGWWAEQLQALKGDYPHSVEQPQEDTYGMVVLSRFPLGDAEVRHLVEDTVPSVFVRVALPSGDAVRLVLLHPRPPRPDIGQNATLRDAELVLAAEAVEDVDGPLVVAGDLNDVAWSRTTRLFQELSGLLDPRIGRGLFATFHADHWFLRYPLDHVFHSDDLTLVELRRLGHVGSDHFPILIELAYVPAAEDVQDTPEAEGAEEAMAEEMVEDAAEMKAEESPEERREREQDDQ